MDKLRIDKWLWAARFYKTRSLACAAVESGRVKVWIVDQFQSVKPARELQIGDRLQIRIQQIVWEIFVRNLSDKRGNATMAQTLYQESAEGQQRRLQQLENLRLNHDPAAQRGRDKFGNARPTRKDRQQVERLRGDFSGDW